MWWKIFFVILLVIQEIQILFIYKHIDKLTLIFEAVIHGKILSIIEKNKDGMTEKIYTNDPNHTEDDDAGN
jgi:hypothetical protein